MKKLIFKKLHEIFHRVAEYHKAKIDTAETYTEKQIYMFGWAYYRQLSTHFWCLYSCKELEKNYDLH